jgi:hypothetical protein
MLLDAANARDIFHRKPQRSLLLVRLIRGASAAYAIAPTVVELSGCRLIVYPTPQSHMASKALIRDQMTQQEPTPTQGTRQVEPEIIPPRADPAGRSPIWVSATPHYKMRIRMTRLGPVGTVVLMLMVVILGLAGLTLLLGFALVGLAAAGAFLIGAIVSGLLRRLSG